ncbi:MAG: DNRLRE domain-containing protein [Pseudomonadota bacterium]
MNKQLTLRKTIPARFYQLLCPGALSLALALTGCGGGGSSSEGSESKQSVQDTNIVITNDMGQVRKNGTFFSVDGYLSRSNKVLKSSGGKNSAVFSPNIGSQGYYRIYLWWPQTAQDAGEVDVIVRRKGGTEHLTVNQKILGGQWNSIGIYELAPGAEAEVEIKDRPGVSALVDAVRFEYVGATAPALSLQDGTLPLANRGIDYAGQIDVNGGVAPYTLTVSQGALPVGLSLDTNTGLISGVPALLGSSQFSVQVQDKKGQRVEKSFSIEVLEASAAPSNQQLSISSDRKHVAEAPPAGTPPDLSNLLGIVASLPEGEWSKVNLNNFSDSWAPEGLRTLYLSSNPTPSKLIEAWSSFAWDSNRGDLILFGGGHANYAGNDVYRWRGSTRQWQRAALSSQVKQDDLGNWLPIDGLDAAPISAHTYDNNIFLPLIDRMVIFGGAAFNNGGAYLRQVTPTTARRTGPYLFDPSKADPNKVGGTTGSHVQRTGPHPEIVGGNMWQNRDIYKNLASNAALPGAHVNGCTAYAQELGRDVVYVGARPPGGGTATNLYKYVVSDVANPSSDTWQTVGIFWNGFDGQTACGYDASRKTLLRIGINSVPFTYWNLNTSSSNNQDVRVIPTDPTGEFATLMANNAFNIRNCGFDFDPIRKDYALWCGDGRVWKVTPPATLSPSGWTITKQRTPTLAVPNGDQGTGILGKWKYVYNLDAFIGLQNASQGNIWVYKPVGWKNPTGNVNLSPKVSISSPTAGQTFNSGNAINITTNATDTDGSIAKVEFFQGSTKIGESLAAPFSFNWTIAPTGTFSVSAIATDNGGAQAISSSVSITVLPGATGTVILQDGVGSYSLTRDTYLSIYAKTTPLGGTTSLMDQYSNYSNLLRFGIFVSEGGPVPNGAIIQSATLGLYKYSYYDMSYSLNRMLVGWSESNATWQQRDVGLSWSTAGALGSGTDFTATPDATAAAGWNPGWVTFDLTTAVQQMSSGQPNLGWRLIGVSGNQLNIKNFYSKEYTADTTLRPKLTVTYSTN